MASHYRKAVSNCPFSLIRIHRPRLFALSYLLVFAACKEILPFRGEDSDSQIDLQDTVEDSLMPNAQGFLLVSNAPFYLQGGWYWFDNGTSIEEKTVYATKKSSNGISNKYVWYDQDVDKITFEGSSGETVPVDDICIEGNKIDGAVTPEDYVALGFEICSTANSEQPFEFPFTFGTCPLNDADIGDAAGNGIRRFQGIAFGIGFSDDSHPEDAFRRIEVQFKERGVDDSELAKCIVQGKDQDTGSSEEETACRYKVSDGKIEIIADAYEAKFNGRKLNLAMLQAIHILVFMNKPEIHYCLSNLYAYGYKTEKHSSEEIGEIEPISTDPVGNPEIVPLEDSDTEWDVLDIGWKKIGEIPNKLDAFEVMVAEVTVGQYLQCVKKGACITDAHDPLDNWETCNVGLFKSTKDDAVKKKAVNCVNWYNASDFCKWINGSLPSEDQWIQAASWGNPNENNADYPIGFIEKNCDHIVMNDINNHGIGCGSRMPADVCSKVAEADTEISDTTPLCDMMGNLWEWVSSDAENTEQYFSISGENWAKGYKKLKGGSLNTTGGSADAFSIKASTIEHPVVPHSPTRLGFRCVRAVGDLN